MKNVLVIYYSQSGQLKEIANNIALPLLNSDEINVFFHEIQLQNPFPFPWDKNSFFDVFPETFLQIPSKLVPISNEVMNTKFDLILLNYQVWYLSPSIPINSFLKSDQAKQLLNGTPIITINGSRNMWVMAQEKVKELLMQNNALLKGNIALVDKSGNLISVITIVKWMFTGVKKRYLGFFPMPGVSHKDILNSSKFGVQIKMALLNQDLDNLQTKLVELKAVKISSYLLKVDKIANKIFNKWSNFIINNKTNRIIWLKVFNLYLFIAIWLISPIVYIIHLLLYPFKTNKIKKEIKYYQSIEYKI